MWMCAPEPVVHLEDMDGGPAATHGIANVTHDSQSDWHQLLRPTLLLQIGGEDGPATRTTPLPRNETTCSTARHELQEPNQTKPKPKPHQTQSKQNKSKQTKPNQIQTSLVPVLPYILGGINPV